MFYLTTLPLAFLKFWFFEAPIGLVNYFTSVNKSFLQLFSLPLLIKTYFKPWKNEYREGLVGFSIGMAVFIKTFVILTDILLLFLLLTAELIILLGFVFWPIGAIILIL